MKNQWITRIEWAVAVLLSVAVLFLLFVRATHAAALWRDEAESVQMARMPQFTDMLRNLQYSSFPVLFSVIVRTYTALFGASDVSLRCFGFAVGVCFLGVTWLHSRSVTHEFPLLLPALIGLNTNFLTAGTWVRGYGIGSVLLLLAFTLTAKLLLQPSRQLLLGVFLSYLASMECLFFNGALVPAIVLAAAVAFLVRGEMRWMGLLLFAAALCAGLAYLTKLLNTNDAQDWGKVLAMPFSFTAFLHQFIAACGGSHLSVSVILLSVVFLALVGAIWRVTNVWKSERAPERDMLLFGAISILTSVLLYCGLFSWIHNEPQQRYFLPLVCLLAITTDLIVVNLCRYYWVRVARISLIIVAMFALPIVAWPEIIKRQSNIDIVAAKVNQDSRSNDLVVVNPWNLGISFQRYYNGPAKWMTLPAINEHGFHRYDLIHAKMMTEQPIADVLDAVRQTLVRGNRVWIVGGARPPEEGLPLALPPAPNSEFGWNARAYGNVWSMQLGDFLKTHVRQGDVVISPGSDVSDSEKVPLLVAQGWQD